MNAKHSPETALKIAIVEDDDILSFLLSEICQAAGCKVVGQARCVPDAQDILSRENPDVLILDFSLEGEQDGMELLGIAKNFYPQMRSILVTGWDFGKLTRRIDFVQPDHVLRKPVMPHELTTLLTRFRQQLEAALLPNVA